MKIWDGFFLMLNGESGEEEKVGGAPAHFVYIFCNFTSVFLQNFEKL